MNVLAVLELTFRASGSHRSGAAGASFWIELGAATSCADSDGFKTILLAGSKSRARYGNAKDDSANQRETPIHDTLRLDCVTSVKDYRASRKMLALPGV